MPRKKKYVIPPIIDLDQALDYEIRSSRMIGFAKWTKFKLLQKVLIVFYAWKVSMRYLRYFKSLESEMEGNE